jgi:preprotein translocase subunit SecE
VSITPNTEEQQDEHPSFVRMIGIVAAGVAITILIFFAVGYAFGRLFL